MRKIPPREQMNDLTVQNCKLAVQKQVRMNFLKNNEIPCERQTLYCSKQMLVTACHGKRMSRNNETNALLSPEEMNIRATG